MFFYASKIIWFFFQPSSVLVFLGLLGAVLLFTRFWRAGRLAVVLSVAGLLIAGLSPLGQAMILPLEERFPPQPADAPPPDGIIVLGGAFDTVVSPARGVMATNEAAERLTELVSLARRWPDAKLIFSGGSERLITRGAREADLAGRILADAGLDETRLVLENESRNTFQNAVMSKSIARPRASERWLVVTSAYHMPRAIGCFRQAGFPVEAWPVDYRTRGYQDLLRPFDKVSEGLRRVDLAAREWVGLAVYYMTGRTEALLPAP